ncbi:6899_t:CDS:2 [Paraglomus occultum]|uniref:6899_t:CDS:1 n=1 Tax=Paraglomus occultum TaxID=144539 RepID=A0A9N9GJ50_9GLOM|nr:6899_t:CDS:2 [Paraglomus occultum]
MDGKLWFKVNGNIGSDEENAPVHMAMRLVLSNSKITAVGAIQTLFEASMYTFVFFWGPLLEERSINIEHEMPFGVIFSR